MDRGIVSAGASELDFDLADRLRKALRFADVSVGDMADYLGVTRQTVGRYINGHVGPDRRTLRLWAIRCGVPLDWLEGLPRVDSNHQPAGVWNDDRPNGRALIERMSKLLSPEDEALIRQAIPIRPRALSR
jgi:transcriptional regulator with XRE-family HTH domain